MHYVMSACFLVNNFQCSSFCWQRYCIFFAGEMYETLAWTLYQSQLCQLLSWVPRKQTEAKGSSSPFSKKNLETVKKLLRSFIQVILLWSISIGKTLPYTLTLNPTPSTINTVPGIKPRASHVVAECPATKPHPTPSPVDLHIWNLTDWLDDHPYRNLWLLWAESQPEGKI